jgi:hypothetical protein
MSTIGVGTRPANCFHPVVIADINKGTIKDTYIQITGTVDQAHNETDGDYHMHILDASVTPTAPSVQLVRCGDVTATAGSLVCEVVPEQPLPAPAVGAKVTVTGTLRYDLIHSWWEVHPVASITVL